jgi:hypothetical protein
LRASRLCAQVCTHLPPAAAQRADALAHAQLTHVNGFGDGPMVVVLEDGVVQSMLGRTRGLWCQGLRCLRAPDVRRGGPTVARYPRCTEGLYEEGTGPRTRPLVVVVVVTVIVVRLWPSTTSVLPLNQEPVAGVR